MAWASQYPEMKSIPENLKTLQLLAPGQEELVRRSGMRALDLLGNIQNQGRFGPIARQARTQFASQTIPSIAERFTSMGSGAQNSSAFQGALGAAGAGLEQSLAALRSEHGLRERGLNQQLLNSLFNVGLTPTFQQLYTPPQNYMTPFIPGIGRSITNSLLGAVPQAATMGLSSLLPGGFGYNALANRFLQSQRPLPTEYNPYNPYALGGIGQSGIGGFGNPALTSNLSALGSSGAWNQPFNYGGY